MLGRELDRSEVLAIGDGMLTDIKGASDNGFDALYISGGIHAARLWRPRRARSGAARGLSGRARLLARSRSCRSFARPHRWDQAIHRVSGAGRIDDALRGGVVAIGNFDGVHRGHQAVLERALSEANERGVPALVLTFEPHPRTVFRPDMPLFVLTPPPMKARLLSLLGFRRRRRTALHAGFLGTLGRSLRDRGAAGPARHHRMPSPASTSISARTGRAARPS